MTTSPERRQVGQRRQALGRLLHPWRGCSASQISSHLACNRSWWWDKIFKSPRQETEAQREGSVMHAMLEDYLQFGTIPDGVLGQCAMAGSVFLPRPPIADPRMIEAGFLLDTPHLPVQIIGFLDLVEPEEEMVTDHKTTSDLKYAKTVEELALDIQGGLYGSVGPAVVEAICSGAEPEIIKRGGEEAPAYRIDPTRVALYPGWFRHVQYQRGRKGPKASETRVFMEVSDLQATLRNIQAEMWKMAGHAVIDDPAQVPANPDHCRKYGRPCEYYSLCAQCDRGFGLEGRIRQAMANQENSMSGSFDWKKSFDAPSAPQAEPIQAPMVSPPVTFKGVAGSTAYERPLQSPEMEALLEPLGRVPSLLNFLCYLGVYRHANPLEMPGAEGKILAECLGSMPEGAIRTTRGGDFTSCEITSRGRELLSVYGLTFPHQVAGEMKAPPPLAGSLFLWGSSRLSVEDAFLAGFRLELDLEALGEVGKSPDGNTIYLIEPNTGCYIVAEASAGGLSKLYAPPTQDGIEMASVVRLRIRDHILGAQSAPVPVAPSPPRQNQPDVPSHEEPFAGVVAPEGPAPVVEVQEEPKKEASPAGRPSTARVLPDGRKINDLKKDDLIVAYFKLSTGMVGLPALAGTKKGHYRKALELVLDIMDGKPIPVVQAPVAQAPVAQSPAVQAAPVQAPVAQAPAVQAPVAQAPAVQAPVEEEPPWVNPPPVVTPGPLASVPAVPVEELPVLIIGARVIHGPSANSLDMVVLRLIETRGKALGLGYGLADNYEVGSREIANEICKMVQMGELPLNGLIVASRSTPAMGQVLAALLPVVVNRGGTVLE